MSRNLSELSGRKGLEDNLFDRLGKMAIETGTIEPEELEKLADEFLVGTANTYGSITFYDFLKPENKGKKVYVCNGSVCLCAGTQKAVKEKLEHTFDASEIGEMCCLGRCHENSSFQYKGKNYSGNDIDNLTNIVNETQVLGDKYKVGSSGKAVLTAPFSGYPAYKELLQSVLGRKKEEVLEEIKTANVRGRGGAGFPMGLKLEFCSKSEGDTKFIICNADEGDPGAFSDRYLLEQRPESVLFGMIVAGYVTGASWGVVYIRGEYPESVEITEHALEKFRSLNMCGEHILGTDFTFKFKIIKAQGSYICGEETALINSIEGQRPEVRVRPPYPAQQGLFGKPTTVNNVETLATIPFIMENGGAAYKSLGTDRSTGTKLISLDSRFKNPGIYEVEMGTPLSKVIYDLGGGFIEEVKALHIGGPLGGMVPIHMVDELTVDFESFANNGFLLGHASVVSIPARFPMVQYLEHLFEFAADESCGKCFPCRLGTKRASEMFAQANEGKYVIDRELFDDLLHTLEEGSLCAHGGGIPLPARNALQYFKDELSPYFN